MNIVEKKLEDSAVEVQITIAADKVDLEFKSVFDEISKTAKVDGFRKGKVPLSIVESKFSTEATFKVTENLVKMGTIDAINEKKINPIGPPKYDKVKLVKGEDFTFKAIFEIFPTIQLGDYKGIKAKERVCEIREIDIKNEVEAMREKQAEVIPKEDSAGGLKTTNGDLVKLKLKRLDKVPEETEEENKKDKFEEHQVVIGKSPDKFAVDKYILGLAKGESKEIEIEYPQNYHLDNFKGKKVKYLVEIVEISQMNLPEYNDDFAKEMQYESKDDLENKIKDYLEKFVSSRIRSETVSRILDEIVEKSKFELPKTMIANEMLSFFRNRLQGMNMPPEYITEFIKKLQEDSAEIPADFKEKLREDAIKSVRSTLVLAEIARKENLEVPKEKYQEAIQNIAHRTNKPVEEVEEIISKNNTRENIEHELLLDEAMNFIYKNAALSKGESIFLDELLKNQVPAS